MEGGKGEGVRVKTVFTGSHLILGAPDKFRRKKCHRGLPGLPNATHMLVANDTDLGRSFMDWLSAFSMDSKKQSYTHQVKNYITPVVRFPNH